MIKRILAVIFATTIATTTLAEDKWAVATAKDNGHRLIIRYRTTVPEKVKPSAYPNMIAVSWKFNSESGMPSSTEKEQMNLLEDRISNEVEPNKIGFLTVVVTGNNVCEWQFYAKDQQEFMRLLNKALTGKPRFPIQISFQNDPKWLAYQQFNGLKSSHQRKFLNSSLDN